MDLTMSSDAEPGSSPKRMTPKRKARTYNIGSYDDDEWDGPVGKAIGDPRETRRNTSVGLRNSSQAALNQNRKKTVSR
jgi:hypothetical protein